MYFFAHLYLCPWCLCVRRKSGKTCWVTRPSVLHVCTPGRENDNLAHLFAVKEDAPKAREEIAEYLDF